MALPLHFLFIWYCNLFLPIIAHHHDDHHQGKANALISLGILFSFDSYSLLLDHLTLFCKTFLKQNIFCIFWSVGSNKIKVVASSSSWHYDHRHHHHQKSFFISFSKSHIDFLQSSIYRLDFLCVLLYATFAFRVYLPVLL